MPAAASADTFCVDHAGCTGAGHNFTTIGGALTAAAGNGSGTLDTIEVGPGTYDEDLADAAGNPVNIVGSGDSTDIAPSSNANNQDVLFIGRGSTSVSSVKITIPAGWAIPESRSLRRSARTARASRTSTWSRTRRPRAAPALCSTGRASQTAACGSRTPNLTASFSPTPR